MKPSSVSTPAQDATALTVARILVNEVPSLRRTDGEPGKRADEIALRIVNALRATSQTPDAVRIASDFWMTISPDKEILRANVRAIGQNIADAITNALRPTPSASAGPQAEAVAWRWRYRRDEELGRWIYNDDRPDFDCTKAMVELEALALAHPQPQQADGRGAVVEATRWPVKGDLMTFLGRNGYPFELEEALKIFKVGNPYRVHDCDVGGWRHSIQFDGVSGRFNGVMFEFAALLQAPATDGPAK